ncbi:hypothetical protein BDD12DRAFT_876360 [Trichophaea hybrida]|nr:hypothetical protein BDD12DRAFT_876360 [Trichophaea hybrida]
MRCSSGFGVGDGGKAATLLTDSGKGAELTTPAKFFAFGNNLLQFRYYVEKLRRLNIAMSEKRDAEGPGQWYLECELMELVKMAYREMARGGSGDGATWVKGEEYVDD